MDVSSSKTGLWAAAATSFVAGLSSSRRVRQEPRRRSVRKAADQTLRYDFVRDGTAWKIDDIKGASDVEAWSICGVLANSLKN